MNEKYSTLKVLYSLVKESSFPTQFACKPTEIITRHIIPWDTILVHLTELATEGLIIYTVPSVVTITQAGLKLMAQMEDEVTLKNQSVVKNVA